jgi:hypothetical protein
VQRAKSLVLCPARFPSQQEAIGQIEGEQGAHYRLAFDGLLTAAALGKSRLSPLVRQHISLAHGRVSGKGNLNQIDIYVEPRAITPIQIGESIIRSSQDLALHACLLLSRTYGVQAGYHPLASDLRANPVADEVAFYGCMDDRFFGRMGAFISKKTDGVVDHCSWAGVITCPHAHEFGVWCDQTTLLLRQLKARSSSRVRRAYIVLHEDCAGHGGTQRLGTVDQQIGYFKERLRIERARIQAARPKAEFQVHFAHAGGGIERIALWLPSS